jgi:hypothetical protein
VGVKFPDIPIPRLTLCAGSFALTTPFAAHFASTTFIFAATSFTMLSAELPTELTASFALPKPSVAHFASSLMLFRASRPVAFAAASFTFAATSFAMLSAELSTDLATSFALPNPSVAHFASLMLFPASSTAATTFAASSFALLSTELTASIMDRSEVVASAAASLQPTDATAADGIFYWLKQQLPLGVTHQRRAETRI